MKKYLIEKDSTLQKVAIFIGGVLIGIGASLIVIGLLQ